MGSFFFVAPTEFDAKASKKQWKTTTNDIMAEVCTLLEGAEVFDSEPLSTLVKGWIVDQGHGFGKVMQPMRLSLVGAPQGPDIFDIAQMLGKEETIKRIQYAMSILQK